MPSSTILHLTRILLKYHRYHWRPCIPCNGHLKLEAIMLTMLNSILGNKICLYELDFDFADVVDCPSFTFTLPVCVERVANDAKCKNVVNWGRSASGLLGSVLRFLGGGVAIFWEISTDRRRHTHNTDTSLPPKYAGGDK